MEPLDELTRLRLSVWYYETDHPDRLVARLKISCTEELRKYLSGAPCPQETVANIQRALPECYRTLTKDSLWAQSVWTPTQRKANQANEIRRIAKQVQSLLHEQPQRAARVLLAEVGVPPQEIEACVPLTTRMLQASLEQNEIPLKKRKVR